MTPARKPMTLTQKILCHPAVGLKRPWVATGDTVRIRADWTIASELAWNGMNATYEKLGRPELNSRETFYLALDHTVDPNTLANDARTQKLVKLSRDFAKEKGLPHFYDANETIMHTKFYRDLVQPGQTVIGADSHTSSHGGLGAFAIGLGGADVCIAMVLGETWIRHPLAAIEHPTDGSNADPSAFGDIINGGVWRHESAFLARPPRCSSNSRAKPHRRSTHQSSGS
jgi:aconitate hydratase/homoaconitate hydratase